MFRWYREWRRKREIEKVRKIAAKWAEIYFRETPFQRKLREMREKD
jgi:hypothetical protein